MSKHADWMEKAKEYVALAEAATPVALEAADDIRKAFGHLAEQGDIDIDDLLTGNPVADRRRLETAELVAAMGRTIDWSMIPQVSFKIAKAGLGLAALFAG